MLRFYLKTLLHLGASVTPDLVASTINPSLSGVELSTRYHRCQNRARGPTGSAALLKIDIDRASPAVAEMRLENTHDLTAISPGPEPAGNHLPQHAKITAGKAGGVLAGRLSAFARDHQQASQIFRQRPSQKPVQDAVRPLRRQPVQIEPRVGLTVAAAQSIRRTPVKPGLRPSDARRQSIDRRSAAWTERLPGLRHR